MSQALYLSKLALRLIALSLGGMGIFSLWASFYVPEVGIFTILCLSTASVITLMVEI